MVFFENEKKAKIPKRVEKEVFTPLTPDLGTCSFLIAFLLRLCQFIYLALKPTLESLL